MSNTTLIPNKRTAALATNLLSKEQLEKIEIGIDAAIKIQQTRPELIYVKHGGGTVMCDPVDAAIFVAEVVLATYAYTKWNQFENHDFFQKQLDKIKALDYKSKFSVKELAVARQELNKLR